KQLTHAGLDAAELAQNDPPWLSLARRPVSKRLQVLEDRVEALREVHDDVVVIERLAMVGVQRGGRPPDQHGAGDQRLELRGLLQDIIKRWHPAMLSELITTKETGGGRGVMSWPGDGAAHQGATLGDVIPPRACGCHGRALRGSAVRPRRSPAPSRRGRSGTPKRSSRTPPGRHSRGLLRMRARPHAARWVSRSGSGRGR